MHWQDLEIELEYTQKIYDRVKYVSPVIAGHFERFAQEESDGKLSNLAYNIHNCSRSWFFDHYKLQRIKDLKSVSYCHSKFCPNCQKTMQASRLLRFSPALNEMAEKVDLYHITFTIPNVSAEGLKAGINTLFSGYKQLIRYFNGNICIKGLDFVQYGYEGSLRALEVTYNSRKVFAGQEYHPHLHCIFALKKGLVFNKKITNKFSNRRGRFDRTFTEMEVLLQKVFYLLANGEQVTLKNIEAVELGYNSVMIKVEKDNYHEIFKYAFKGFSQDHKIMSYEQLKVLYKAFYKRRTIQGYGKFYRLAVDDSIDESMNEEYNHFIEKLKLVEDPVLTSNSIEEVNDALGRKFMLYISRKSIFKLQREIEKHEEKVESNY
jgi:hypothetical protein